MNFFYQILKNCHFGVKKKKSLPTHVDLHDPYVVHYTIPQGYYNFPRSTNKIPFFDKISTSGRISRLMKDLKYKNQSTNMNTKFWGGGGGVGVGGGVGYYDFPRSTNKIKSFDEILTSEKKLYFFGIFLLWEGQT